MKSRSSWIVAQSAAVISAVVSLQCIAADRADVVYLNGKVVTVDSHFQIVQAFATAADRIIAIGSNATLRKLAGPDTRVVDLGGRTVLPGFIDTHPHTINGHARQQELSKVSLYGVSSVAEVIERIRKAAQSAAPGAWIVTTDIGAPPDFFNLPASLAEKRWPTRGDLDQAAPNNPVYINNSTKQPYPSVFNSTALRLLGVTRDFVNEERVHVETDAAGEPNGLIYGLDLYSHDSPLRGKLLSMLPRVSPQVRQEVIKLAIQDNNAVGVTALYEAHGSQPIQVQYLQAVRAAGDLKDRFVVAYEIPAREPLAQIERWMSEHPESAGAGQGDDFLRVRGVTVSMDGATQMGASLMNKPYLDIYGRVGNGASVVSEEKVAQIAGLAVKHDLQLNVQAAGDQAIDMAVRALQSVDRQTPIGQRGWVIEHVQHPSRENIAALKKLGMAATTYSSVDFSKGAQVYVDRFPGQDVWKTVVPLRWWFDGGVTVAQSTDGAHYEPMFTIWQSLVRMDGGTGKSLLTPAKTISREESIRMYTINGARVMGYEDRIGSIEPGKYADFVVLDHDILKVSVAEIRATKVVLTAIAGKIVYGSLP